MVIIFVLKKFIRTGNYLPLSGSVTSVTYFYILNISSYPSKSETNLMLNILAPISSLFSPKDTVFL